MTSMTATVRSTMETGQGGLSTVQTVLTLMAYQFPTSCTPTNGSYFDHLIVGCGTSGSVLASRLSEDSGVSVLALEAGGVPPFESSLPYTFPLLATSEYDYTFYGTDDGVTAQNTIHKGIAATQGKGLGGTGLLNHMIHVQRTKNDADRWVNITGGSIWSYENTQPFMKMQENLIDPVILQSSYASNHGTSGPKPIKRQPSATNDDYLKAYEEMGYATKLDVSDENQLGANQPLLNIADGERQTNARTYLKLAENRTNLCVAMSFTVTKILFNGTTAYGVQAVDSNGDIYEFYTRKEVIISAGAINSAKLLLLSGIGNSAALKALDITPVADLPVGECLQDHVSAPVVYQMAPSTETTRASDPHKFPVDMHTLYASLVSDQEYPTYQSIGLLFPHDSTALIQLCNFVFQISEDICNAYYAASAGRNMLMAVVNLATPESCGKVELKSANYEDAPTIVSGLLSNSNDLITLAKSLQDYDRVSNTTFFKESNASLVDAGLCPDLSGLEYYKCLALALSNTMWHYSATNAMGSVLNSDLTVIGVDRLRVIDASSMPTVPSGNIEATVTMVAEIGAKLIKDTWA